MPDQEALAFVKRIRFNTQLLRSFGIPETAQSYNVIKSVRMIAYGLRAESAKELTAARQLLRQSLYKEMSGRYGSSRDQELVQLEEGIAKRIALHVQQKMEEENKNTGPGGGVDASSGGADEFDETVDSEPEDDISSAVTRLRREYRQELVAIKDAHESGDKKKRADKIRELLKKLRGGDFTGNPDNPKWAWFKKLRLEHFLSAATGRPASDFADEPPVGPVDFNTMAKLRRQAYVRDELDAISNLLHDKEKVKARVRADFLLEQMRKVEGESLSLTAEQILTFAQEAIKPATAKAGTEDPMETQLGLDLVTKVDWNNFCQVYGIAPEEKDALKDVARLVAKKGEDSTPAINKAKELLGKKKNGKTKVKIKNGRHLTAAIEDVMRKRAGGKKLSTPLKPSEIDDEAETVV